MVMQSTSSLPLRGVDVGASDPSQARKSIGLANVYIDLDSTEKIYHQVIGEEAVIEIDEERITSVLQLVINNRHLVLLGNPGGGKSTFVNFLAYCLAANSLDPQAGWIEQLPGWLENEANLIPVVVILRDFPRQYAGSLPIKAEPHHLMDFIKSRLEAQKLGFAYEPMRESARKWQGYCHAGWAGRSTHPVSSVFLCGILLEFLLAGLEKVVFWLHAGFFLTSLLKKTNPTCA